MVKMQVYSQATLKTVIQIVGRSRQCFVCSEGGLCSCVRAWISCRKQCLFQLQTMASICLSVA